MQVLIIGDARSTRFYDGLICDCFRPVMAPSLEHAVRERLTEGIGAIILEFGTNTSNAADHIRRLRDRGIDHPMLILSDHARWQERVDCLDAGADDYLLKPVRPEEIAARLRAIIRRGAGSARAQLTIGRVSLDLKHRSAYLANHPLALTRHEFRLLQALAMRPGQILQSSELREILYQTGSDRSLNAVEVQIARLRRKIGRDCIRTVRGLGYRLDPDACAIDAAVAKSA